MIIPLGKSYWWRRDLVVCRKSYWLASIATQICFDGTRCPFQCSWPIPEARAESWYQGLSPSPFPVLLIHLDSIHELLGAHQGSSVCRVGSWKCRGLQLWRALELFAWVIAPCMFLRCLSWSGCVTIWPQCGNGPETPQYFMGLWTQTKPIC